ncbi:MAG: ABC transporter permease [Oscillospiraceae bacterium]|jgi:ABC-type uncharacterized transport system permease subunit
MSGTWNFLITFITAAVLTGTTLMYGTLGEILTEKSGNMNLGVEGLMFMGGASGTIAAYYYEAGSANPSAFVSVLIAMLVAFLIAVFGSLIFSFLTITLRANQNVTGLALTIFGTGFGKFFGEYVRLAVGGRLIVASATKDLFQRNLFPAFMSKIPVIGPLLFSYSFMVYLGIAIAIFLHWFFNRSRVGLNLRAVGENPATADAAGISVIRYRYLATCIGGGICGLGGLYFVMVTGGGTWSADAMDGKGWLAVALVIFALWRPMRAVWGSIVFGMLTIMYMRVTGLGIPTEIYKILPYVVTIIVLILVSMKQKRENQPPAGLGQAYFREER